jgi:hypothetical protein
MLLPNTTLSPDMIVDGAIMDHHFDNQFLRWRESFEKYSSFLSDMDDLPIHETDDFEKLKQGKAKKKDVVGVTPITAKQDSDEVFEFYDVEDFMSNSMPQDDQKRILTFEGLILVMTCLQTN